jgi:uncharacterized protein (DUF2384 family)
MLIVDLPPARIPQRPRAPAATAAIGSHSSDIDSRAIALFDSISLRNDLRQLDKLELAGVWRLTRQVLADGPANTAAPLSAIEIHRRLLEGLAGESLLISSAMFLSTLAEAEKYFGMSFKTIKSRLGGLLDTAASEKAMRAARATLTAAELLGSFDAARAYLHSRNFALGGATPAELIRTADGERIVLNELQAQAEGGPL